MWLLFSLGTTVPILGVIGIFMAVLTAVITSTTRKEITKKL